MRMKTLTLKILVDSAFYVALDTLVGVSGSHNNRRLLEKILETDLSILHIPLSAHIFLTSAMTDQIKPFAFTRFGYEQSTNRGRVNIFGSI